MMLFFWLLMGGGFATMAVCILDPFGWFSGTGTRRALPPAEARAAGSVPCENCGHLPGMPTEALLAESDRSYPAAYMAARAGADLEQGAQAVVAAETVRDASLAALALPGEEEMAAFLEGERAKAATARTEAVTETLPVVPVKSLHEALNTVPTLGDAVREVSAVSADRAVLSVAATVGSAS